MPDRFHAAVYWSRQDTREECAQRAETFFRLLADCDPVFMQWFEQASSPKKALQLPFEPTAPTFLRFFARKAYQIGWNSFIFGAWTGHVESGHGSRMTMVCGAAAKRTPNNCLLHLPSQEPEASRVLSLPTLRGVLRALVLAWEPDWGGVISNTYRELRSEPVGRPLTGWLMYLSRHRGALPPLPEPVHTEPVEDKGTLLLLTTDCFDTTNPAHVALADDVRERLARAGLLEPTLPTDS